MRMKKFMSFLLTAVMVLSMLPVTAFAANNTATTMRLAKTQGTVTVTNATDKVVKQTDNMKLYNGYKLKTDAESYAWISLDDTKAAKLDANSELSVQKSGKKLTLYLSSGNVFFNVKESLKGDESLNIKTSTMTMGIRGTSGCVRVINPRVSEVHLMTGTVEVLVEHPEINLSKSAIITAGTVATSLIDKEAIEVSGEPVEIVIEELMEETVCGNCAVEIADDVDLQERIEEETDLDVEEIISEAEEKLVDDEKAAEEKQESIEEAIDNQEFPEVVDPYFEETVESSDGGGSTGGTPVVPPTEPDTPSEPEEPVDPGLVSSWAELVEKIKTYNLGTEDMTITLGCNLPSTEDLSSGADLELLPAVNDANGATLTLNLSEYTLAMEDTWVNNGKLVITNTDGMIGEYTDPDPFFNVIKNNGHLTLERGTIVVYAEGTGVFNSEGATFIMEGGSFKAGELVIDANNEITYSMDVLNNTDYSVAVSNDLGGYVEINGGSIETFDGIHDSNTAVSGGEYDVKITGGTFTPVGYWTENNALYIEGNAYISNATFNMNGDENTAIYSYGGIVEVDSGTFNMAGAKSEAVVLDGGSITINGGTWELGEADTAYGIYSDRYYDDEIVINGGTFNVNGSTFVYAENGSVTMSNGTVNIENNGKGIVADGTTDVTFSAGKINVDTGSVGIEVSTDAELIMTRGDMYLIGADTRGIVNHGTATLSKGRIYVNNPATGSVGITSDGTLVNNGTRMWTYAGIATEITGGKVTLDEGAGIWSYNTANSVVITDIDNTELTRPVKADISSEKYDKTVEDSIDSNGVFYPKLTDMRFGPGPVSPDANTQSYKLVDEYGKVIDPLTFAEKVQLFNDGSDDYTITLEEDVDMTDLVDVDALPSVGESSSDTKTLTVDLNGMTLTLAKAWVNLGNLIIKDSGTGGEIVGDVGDRLISNSGNLTWESGTLTVTTEAASGIDSAGTFVMNGGTIKASDASLQTSNMVAVDIISGRFEMFGGVIESETTISNFPSGVSYYNPVGLRNAGTSTLYGGEIKATTIRSVAVSNISLLNIAEDANISVLGENSTAVVNAGTVNMAGTVTATGAGSTAFNMNSSGDMVNFTGGMISAENDTAIAYVSNNNTNISSEIKTVIRAKDPGRIWIGNLPEGFELPTVMDDGQFYYLQSAWVRFVNEIEAFNAYEGTEDVTITLTNDVNPTEEDLLAAELPEAIGNANGTKLTLNLGTYKLALPMTMMMDNSELIITGTTGSITADDLIEPNADLISASSGVTLSGGSIVVPTDYTGIFGDVKMTGGSVVVNGGIGIASAVSSTLSGGTITINEGIGIEGGSGTTSLEGTGFTVNGGTGVNDSVGTVNMSSGEILIYEGKGISSSSTVEFEGGNITVGDIDNGVDSIGIEGVGGGAISLADGTITAEGSSAIAVYADSITGGQGNGTEVEFDGTARIRASLESKVLVPDPGEFGFYTEYDGELYYCLRTNG